MSGERYSTTASQTSDASSPMLTPAVWHLVGGAAIASLAAWGTLQGSAVNEWFDIPERLQKIYQPNQEQAEEIFAATRVAGYKNNALVVGIFGALIAGILGMVGAFRSRSPSKAVTGLLSGIIIGGALGAAGGTLGMALGEQLTGEWPPQGFFPPAAMHAVYWAFIGCAAGLAVGIPTGSRTLITKSTFAAVGAGLVFGFLYVFLASFLFPLARSEEPIPVGAWNRLLWTALPTVLIGIAIGRVASAGKKS